MTTTPFRCTTELRERLAGYEEYIDRCVCGEFRTNRSLLPAWEERCLIPLLFSKVTLGTNSATPKSFSMYKIVAYVTQTMSVVDADKEIRYL